LPGCIKTLRDGFFICSQVLQRDFEATADNENDEGTFPVRARRQKSVEQGRFVCRDQSCGAGKFDEKLVVI
jgi:hypothetical protein